MLSTTPLKSGARCRKPVAFDDERNGVQAALSCLPDPRQLFHQLGYRVSAMIRRRRLLSALEREAKAQEGLLPVLSRQLQDVISTVDTGARTACTSFQGMATLARNSANLGERLIQSEGGSNVNGALDECRATMRKLLDRLEQSGKLYEKAILQMESVGTSVQRVFLALKELDQCSYRSRLTAINAKIEAVHVGQVGAGFELVAEEVSSQAIRSGELTASVVAILTELSKTMGSATSELKSLAAADYDAAQKSRSDAEQALENLQHTSMQMQNTVAESGRTSETLYKEISNAVMSMQFQDRVSQRVGHVIDSLVAMERALSQFEAPADDPFLANRKEQLANEMAASYTMASERVALDSSPVPVSAGEGIDAGGDVELF